MMNTASASDLANLSALAQIVEGLQGKDVKDNLEKMKELSDLAKSEREAAEIALQEARRIQDESHFIINEAAKEKALANEKKSEAEAMIVESNAVKAAAMSMKQEAEALRAEVNKEKQKFDRFLKSKTAEIENLENDSKLAKQAAEEMQATLNAKLAELRKAVA